MHNELCFLETMILTTFLCAIQTAKNTRPGCRCGGANALNSRTLPLMNHHDAAVRFTFVLIRLCLRSNVQDSCLW